MALAFCVAFAFGMSFAMTLAAFVTFASVFAAAFATVFTSMFARMFAAVFTRVLSTLTAMFTVLAALAVPMFALIIEFIGWLPNGAKFDSSEDRGQPEEFPIGARRVIVGKEEAVTGMQIGGVRRVVMPPELGYGSRGRGEIPPNATLVYEIRLIEIKM